MPGLIPAMDLCCMAYQSLLLFFLSVENENAQTILKKSMHTDFIVLITQGSHIKKDKQEQRRSKMYSTTMPSINWYKIYFSKIYANFIRLLFHTSSLLKCCKLWGINEIMSHFVLTLNIRNLHYIQRRSTESTVDVGDVVSTLMLYICDIWLIMACR